MLIILGESGGTKTDWVVLKDKQVIERFTSESYHPVNWGEEFFDRVAEFWTKKPDLLGTQVYLFSAGCLKEQKAKELQNALESFGMHAHVSSDLQAAGIALYGLDGCGKVGIMGTGSVVFDFCKGAISNVVGGKGHEKGDQGSAYYFGKLLIGFYAEQLQNNSVENRFENFFSKISVPQLDDKYGVAQLASHCHALGLDFSEIHSQNIREFILEHGLTAGDSIALSGTYAWYMQDVLKDEFEKKGIFLKEVIERPINQLVEQIDVIID